MTEEEAITTLQALTGLAGALRIQTSDGRPPAPVVRLTGPDGWGWWQAESAAGDTEMGRPLALLARLLAAAREAQA